MCLYSPASNKNSQHYLISIGTCYKCSHSWLLYTQKKKCFSSLGKNWEHLEWVSEWERKSITVYLCVVDKKYITNCLHIAEQFLSLFLFYSTFIYFIWFDLSKGKKFNFFLLFSHSFWTRHNFLCQQYKNFPIKWEREKNII